MISLIRNILNKNLYAVALYSRKIASAFIIFIIARFLTVYDYGLYSAYRTIVLYVLAIANLGFSEYIVVSAKQNTGLVRVKQIFFIFFGCLVLLCYCFSQCLFPLENHLLFILLLFNMFFDNTFFALALPYFQVSKKFKDISIINIVYSLTLICISIYAYIFKIGLIKFVFLNVVLGCINFIQTSIRAKLNYLELFKIIKEDFKSILDRNLIYFALVAITILTYSQLPALAVSTILSKEEAALYFAAYNIASILFLFVAAQSQQIISDLVSSDYYKILKTIKYNTFLVVVVNLIATLFFIIFGKILLNIIYGNEYYSNSYWILIILALVQIFSGIGGIAGTYITAQNLQKNKFYMQIEFVIITILLLLLFHKFKLTGIVITFALSQLYTSIRYFFFMLNDIKKLK